MEMTINTMTSQATIPKQQLKTLRWTATEARKRAVAVTVDVMTVASVAIVASVKTAVSVRTAVAAEAMRMGMVGAWLCRFIG